MIEIKVHNNDVDKALRVMKKIINNEGILQEIKERRYYLKPSEISHANDKRIKRERQRNRKRRKK